MSDPIAAEHAARLAESVLARGNNLVFSAPPAPSAARPVLAGMLATAHSGLRLALAPEATIDEWARVAAETAAGLGREAAGAHTVARLSRLLQSDKVDLLVTTPEAAYELVRRAVLSPAELAGVLLIWPETWAQGSDEVAPLLLQDVSKDAQRVIITTDLAGSAPMIERYCWRAHLTDLLGPESPAAPSVRAMPVAWSTRPQAVLDLLEQLDPPSLAVWAPYAPDRAELERVLAGAAANAVIGPEIPEPVSLVVAYDLPSPVQLQTLGARGDVVLLTPPGTEAYLRRLAPNRRPIHLLGGLHTAQAGLSRTRRAIAQAVERGPAPGTYAAIAPLLERYEATTVTAALFELWQAANTGAQAAPTSQAASPEAQLWVGIGKRDGVTPHDLVATLLGACKVTKEAIGRIDIRESFSLVQLSGAVDAAAVAESLTGKTIRKRRLVARVDKKAVRRRT